MVREKNAKFVLELKNPLLKKWRKHVTKQAFQSAPK